MQQTESDYSLDKERFGTVNSVVRRVNEAREVENPRFSQRYLGTNRHHSAALQPVVRG